MKNKFWVALWTTAITIVGLSVAGLAVTAIFVGDAGPTIWLAAFILCGVAFVAAIIPSLAGIRDIAKGIWVGAGIGIVSVVATFFPILEMTL